MTDSQDDTRRSGYLSEESKRRFTLLAGILGGVFFVMQILLPMAAMFAFMPAMMLGWSVASFEVSDAVLYRGDVHLVETTLSLGESGGHSSSSRLVRLEPEAIDEVAVLENWKPRLLADGDRLWLVASDRMAALEGGRIRPLPVAEPLGGICHPFLLDGAPAVVERRPDGTRLLQWEDGRWRERGPLRGMRDVCSIQGLGTDDGLLLVREDGDTLYSTWPMADAPRWTVALSSPGQWRLLELDGHPAIVSVSTRGLFRIVRLERDHWISSANLQVPGGAVIGEIAALQERAGAPLTVVSQGFPGSLRVRVWDGERLVEQRRLGRSSLFPSGMVLFMTLPHLGTLLLSLLLALILARMMRTHRIGTYRHEGREVAYASLTRRAVAQIVDASMLGLPALLLFWRTFSDLEQLVEAGPLFPLRFFVQMAAALAWGVLVLAGLAVTEGLWGWTPGKLLTGIRVVGTDLRPCGIGRALVRNLLKLVDGFFNFLIGILMVAFTAEWQRLGDLAARTIVIRKGG